MQTAFSDIAQGAGEGLTPLKLQQLAYLSHGWYLSIAREPLIGEGVQAWKHGPVVRSMYHEFEDFGDDPITRPARQLRCNSGIVTPDSVELYEPSLNDDDPQHASLASGIIDQVWHVYGDSPFQLSNMSHGKGTPWDAIHARFRGEIPNNVLIPNDLIHEYFLYRLRQSRFSAHASQSGMQPR